MDRQEEIKIKNQKAEEAMRRARQAQQANEKMQRELKAAARELARHQELARKASMQESAAREEAAAARKITMETPKASTMAGGGVADRSRNTVRGQQGGSRQGVIGSQPQHGGSSQGRADAALKQQEASREAARQAMIYEAAKRRAEKKEAAKRAAELVAAQRAAEKKVHHTSPETKELQRILLQQIADIMEEEDPEENPEEVRADRNPSGGKSQKSKADRNPSEGTSQKSKTDRNPSGGKDQKPKTGRNPSGGKSQKPKTDKSPEPVSATEDFGDLVIMDIHGEELQPESSAALEKKARLERIAEELDAAPETEPEAKLETWGRMGTWFQTFCWMHIPVVGFWYMVVVAVRKKTPKEKKAFARAYILYKILVLILACTILYIFYRVGLDFIEQILSYMEAHQ